MPFDTVSFLQVSFYSTPIFSKTLIHPVSPVVSSPDNRSWKAVSDEILSGVGSRSLLTLVINELQRELNSLALGHITGWVFHTNKALLVKDKLEQASRRYASIRDGVFANELRDSLAALFSRDPRFQARLSEADDTDEAVEEVCRRVMSQCRLTWELGLFNVADRRSFGIRLMVLMHDMIYDFANQKGSDSEMLSFTRFNRIHAFAEKMEQFRGIDSRFDRALADYKKLLMSFPDDASYLYGGGLKDFWRELTRLGDYLKGELEGDFYEQPDLQDDYDEQNLYWHIESDDTLEDLVTWDQCETDCGVDLGWNPDAEPGIPTANMDVDNFSLEPTVTKNLINIAQI